MSVAGPESGSPNHSNVLLGTALEDGVPRSCWGEEKTVATCAVLWVSGLLGKEGKPSTSFLFFVFLCGLSFPFIWFCQNIRNTAQELEVVCFLFGPKGILFFSLLYFVNVRFFISFNTEPKIEFLT